MPRVDPTPSEEAMWPPRMVDAVPRDAGIVASDHEATVSARLVRGLARGLEEAGRIETSLLEAAGLAHVGTRDGDERISCHAMDRLCTLALDRSAQPALGLHCAALMSPTFYPPVSHLLVHSSCLRQSLDMLLRYQRLLHDASTLALVEEGERVVMNPLEVGGGSLRVRRLKAELTMAGLLRLVRQFVPRAEVLAVDFSYPPPPGQAEYARVFQGRARFAQDATRVVLARSLLDAPAPDYDHEVHEALRALAEARLKRRMRDVPYARRVEEYLLRQDEWRERPDMPTVAQALGLSARSLRRRLTHEGSSFTQVTNRALGTVAKRLLRQQRGIQETAFVLGFADTSSFHRAFKKWTGATPSACRGARVEHDDRS